MGYNHDDDDDQSPTPPPQGYSTQHETAQPPTSHTTERNSVAPGTLVASSTNEHPELYRHHSVRRAIGLHAKTPIDADHAAGEHHNLFWPKVRAVLREPIAEFWGVFFMVLFGNGSVAQVLLTEGSASAPGGNGNGNYQSINWCWGLGVMLGIYIAGDSGAYLNPAVTFANCLYRGLPWRRFPIFLLAQFLGGFCASGVVYINYIDAIDDFAGYKVRSVPPAAGATAGIFCTFPAGYLTKASQFFSEFIASAILIFVIFALKDKTNSGGIRGDANFFPLALFFLIFGIGASFGSETGYALNLARDFGPRLMSFAVGYGGEVWSAGNYYFWVPIVAPFCGCIFGGFLYDVSIYTGPESPINSPWMGFKHLVHPQRALQKRWSQREKEVPDDVMGGYVEPDPETARSPRT